MTTRARSPTGPRAVLESPEATCGQSGNEASNAPESPRASRQPGQVWRATVSSAIKQKPNSQSPYLRRRSMSPIHLLRTRGASEPGPGEATDGHNDENDATGPLSAGPVLQGGKWIIPSEPSNQPPTKPIAPALNVKRAQSPAPEAKPKSALKGGRSRSVSRAASIKHTEENEPPSPVVAEPPTPAANRLLPGAFADSLQLAVNGNDANVQQPPAQVHRDKMHRSPSQQQQTQRQASQPQVIPETRGSRTTERMMSALDMDPLLDRPKPPVLASTQQHHGHQHYGNGGGMRASASVTVTEVLNAYDTDSVVDPDSWPEDPSMPVGYHHRHYIHERAAHSTHDPRQPASQNHRHLNQSNSSDWTARPYSGSKQDPNALDSRHQAQMRDSQSTFHPMTSDIDPVATSPTPARSPFQPPHPSTSAMLGAPNTTDTTVAQTATAHPAHPYSTYPIPNLSDFDLHTTMQPFDSAAESHILASSRRRERRLVATVCALKAQLDDHRISNTQLSRQVNALMGELQTERYARQMAEHAKEVAELKLAEAKRKEDEVGEERKRLEGVWRELERAVGSVRAEVTGPTGGSRGASFYAPDEGERQHGWEQHHHRHDVQRGQPTAQQQQQVHIVEYRPQSSFAGHISTVGDVNSPPRQQHSTTQISISTPPNSTPLMATIVPNNGAYVASSTGGAGRSMIVPGPRPAALSHRPHQNDKGYWSTKQERMLLQEQQRLHHQQQLNQPKHVESGARPAAMVQVGSTRLHQAEDERWAQVAALVANARGRSQEAGNGSGR